MGDVNDPDPVGQLDASAPPTGTGTWISYDGLRGEGIPELGHRMNGALVQFYTVINGQARLKVSQQYVGTLEFVPAPNITRDENGIWTDIQVPLFPPTGSAVYAHTVNYSENEYDEDTGVLVYSQSAFNTYDNDQIMTHGWQITRYETRFDETLQRNVRDTGHIQGQTLRFDYTPATGAVDTTQELERTFFETTEKYEVVAMFRNLPLVRRTLSENHTETFGMDGSYNDQTVKTTFAYYET